MSLEPQTRQQLLELVYDLLPEAEAVELRQRMDAEPELARAYAEARDTAKVLAEAARLPTSKIQLTRPEKTISESSDSPQPQAVLRTEGPSSTPWARGANWVVGLAAAVLLMLSIGGYLYHCKQRSKIAAKQVRLRVTGPASLQAGVPAEYTITTTTVHGKPLPAQITFAVYSPGEERPEWRNETTGEDGQLAFAIAGEKVVRPHAVLKVVAQCADTDETEEVETRLAVEPVRYLTQLALERPLYRADEPDETIYYRSLTLSRFGLAADREVPIHFEILDPSGAVVRGSEREGVTQNGVGSGSFKIPPGLPGGVYTLVARSPDDSFPEEKQTFFIRHYRLPRLKKQLEFTRESYAPGDTVTAGFYAEKVEGGPAAGARLQINAIVDGKPVFQKHERTNDLGAFQVKFDLPKEMEAGDGLLRVTIDDGGNLETIVETIPTNLGKVEVTFFPEGGTLVHGLENRVYFAARNPLGKPVHVKGRIVDSSGTEVAGVETTHRGMGSFSFRPSAKEQYRLKITSPPNAEDQPLTAVSTKQKIVLTAGSGVFDADEPLEFNVRAAEAGLPLVVSARCRGVPVGQHTLETDHGANPVRIQLAEEVGGVIRLTVYDYRTSPPEPVAERLVYRRMRRRLLVSAAAEREGVPPGEPVNVSQVVTNAAGKRVPVTLGRYSPGEKLEMSLTVSDEKGERVPAVLGLAAVDDALLSLADDLAPGVNTHFLLTTEVEKPEDLEDADFHLSGHPQAAVALDLLLGTQGWRRFVEKTLKQARKEGPDNQRLTRLAAINGLAAPPAMFDNLAEVREKYQASLAEYEAGRTNTLKALPILSFFGGLGLVLLVAMLGLLKVVSGAHLWVPAVGVTTCCLIIGVILMDPARFTSDPHAAIAFLPYNIEPAEDAQPAEPGGKPPGDGDRAKGKAEMVDAPAAKSADFADEGPAKLMGRKHNGRRAVEKSVAGKGIKGLAAPGGRMRKREVAAGGEWKESWDKLVQKPARHRLILRVEAYGNGRIGTGQAEVTSRIPFDLHPKLPPEVGTGDRIILPLAVVNDTQGEQTVKLTLEHGSLVTPDGKAERTLELAPGQCSREYFTLDVTGREGDCKLTFRGTAGDLTRTVVRPLKIVPSGASKKLPHGGQNCPVQLSTKLANKRVKAGETVALTAELTNTADQPQPMTVAILGLPAGLEVRPDQLEELKKAGTFDYYQTRAREVICYWRSLAAEKKVTIKLDLVAEVPGKYVGPASRTYLYHTSEQKQWSRPLEVEIATE